eukprot:gene15807-13508_t
MWESFDVRGLFVERFGAVFTSSHFKARWFHLAECAVTYVYALICGSALPMKRADCDRRNLLLAAVALVWFVLLLVLQPMRSRVSNVTVLFVCFVKVSSLACFASLSLDDTLAARAPAPRGWGGG